MNNDFLSRVRRFGNDFHEWRSHEWKSLPNRLTSDKKSLFTVTNVLFYFLHAILCHEHTNTLRTIIERSFRHCCQWRPFLTEHCDVTTIDLWRHANANYWYCDVIFVYCHCTRKLAQRRSSLVNNSREYRYLATRYSRLSVLENIFTAKFKSKCMLMGFMDRTVLLWTYVNVVIDFEMGIHFFEVLI